jgi:four helix bundle protein
MGPTYEQWLETVPKAVTSDAVWRMEAVRRAAWAGQHAVEDAVLVQRLPGCHRVADQLVRATGSIIADLWEGLGRTSVLDRARYVSYSLESLREAMSWYLLARSAFPSERFDARLEELVAIRRILIAFLRNHHRRMRTETGEP